MDGEPQLTFQVNGLSSEIAYFAATDTPKSKQSLKKLRLYKVKIVM